jgi:hypothetical protein
MHKVELVPGANFQSGTVRVWLASDRFVEITAAEARQALQGNARNDPVRIAAVATSLLQSRVDTRIPRTSLPPDDPARLTDPARPNFFWDGLDLVAREGVVTVLWTGAQYTLEWRVV